MIEATSKLLQQVMTQQATASHLSELSVECGGAPLVLQELEQLAETAGLKAMLWSMQQEMRDLGKAWMQGQLFELDVAEMQAKVGAGGGSVLWIWNCCSRLIIRAASLHQQHPGVRYTRAHTTTGSRIPHVQGPWFVDERVKTILNVGPGVPVPPTDRSTSSVGRCTSWSRAWRQMSWCQSCGRRSPAGRCLWPQAQ